MSSSDRVPDGGLEQSLQSSQTFPSSQDSSVQHPTVDGRTREEFKVTEAEDAGKGENGFLCDAPPFLHRPRFLKVLSRILCGDENVWTPSSSPQHRIPRHVDAGDSRNLGVVDSSSTSCSHFSLPPTSPAPSLPSCPPVASSGGSFIMALAFGSTVWWCWRSLRTVEKELSRRYADTAYQIRRPDALSNRIVAFKYLVGGGLAIPLLALGACAVTSFRRKTPRASEAIEKMCVTSRNVDAQQRESENSATASVPAIKKLPNSWELALRERVQLFSKGYREFITVVMPQQEAWRQWASAARPGQSTGPLAFSYRHRERSDG
ncbi:putative transmembrane protein [Toxoplasma gondii RUB]|uniref:Transmembrane protein n=13 Tax=Toxoplasma gondii TaxID=5811 RepID=A0A125YU59_TOXGG|nr:hypothetical protein TGGT1_213490 [Toxoplasma gondii GT1]ESS30774.1 putative transmembrane protein [Toxoplasma gondii VEG]KAF4643716.1 hypothetical protein TGRH88_024710 [Toxoplasma gondii]KFG40306.1 putative transmembrane protein [Toxoplasma gondii GAB2-2007-GAL-DOM2]KFG44387.1 putative transmembrane protein [Toxoplasma gondii p89]KFG54923.1 putative transmembrane protein [Toxoplasma gondii FOU]KFG63121.1 putative transmembrane protein [Toxoplasma gondii RUB]KFH08629.1 putative transmemb